MVELSPVLTGSAFYVTGGYKIFAYGPRIIDKAINSFGAATVVVWDVFYGPDVLS